jgi:hypothetical protein
VEGRTHHICGGDAIGIGLFLQDEYSRIELYRPPHELNILYHYVLIYSSEQRVAELRLKRGAKPICGRITASDIHSGAHTNTYKNKTQAIAFGHIF